MNPYAVPSLLFRTTQYANALCRESDPGLFFPDPTDKESTAKAKLICSWCVHKKQCRADARKRGELYGVFGGESEQERRKFIRSGAEPIPSQGRKYKCRNEYFKLYEINHREERKIAKRRYYLRHRTELLAKKRLREQSKKVSA